MALTVQAMIASVGLAAFGAGCSVAYFKPRQRLAPTPFTPAMAAQARLYLHRIDIVSYTLAAAGVLTLVPDAVQVFAPELMYGESLVGSGLEHLDYLSFVLVSLSFGMGIARRTLFIALEKASLRPCP